MERLEIFRYVGNFNFFFTFWTCCSGNSIELDNELNLSDCKPEETRTRSNSSYLKNNDDRRSTNTSNYRHAGLLETIYEDDFSADATF